MEKNKVLKFFTSKLFILMLFFVLIVVVFTIISPGSSYLKPSNIRNILNSMVLFILFAIAEGMLLISGELDFSPGYVGTVAGVILAALLKSTGLPWFMVVLICIAFGAVFGLLNAFLVNELGFQSFIATLATGMFVAKGLALIIVAGNTLSIKDPTIVWLGTGRIFTNVPVTIIISLLAILIYGIILSRTKFGRSIYLCGGNRNAARLAGLNPKRLSYILFANSGALGALAGILYAGRLKVGDSTATNSYAFPAITAAILGGISFGGGSGGMAGCFLGLLIINGFNNGLTIVGVSPHWQQVASGLLLLLALTLDYFTSRNAQKVKRPKLSTNS